MMHAAHRGPTAIADGLPVWEGGRGPPTLPAVVRVDEFTGTIPLVAVLAADARPAGTG